MFVCCGWAWVGVLSYAPARVGVAGPRALGRVCRTGLEASSHVGSLTVLSASAGDEGEEKEEEERDDTTSEDAATHPLALARSACAGVGARARRRPLAYAPALAAAWRAGTCVGGGGASCAVRAFMQTGALIAVWQATAGCAEARARCVERFRRDPAQHALVTPLTAAFVGWFTNWVGVQMLFYPLQWRGIPAPFGWLQRRPCGELGTPACPTRVHIEVYGIGLLCKF